MKGRCFAFFLAVACTAPNVRGQQAETLEVSPTDGSTPLALTPGAPAGSFPLSGFDTVNLYNGNLSFRLPLLTIGGRGDAHTTLTLPIQRRWSIRKRSSHDGPTEYQVQENSWSPLEDRKSVV